MKIHLKKLCPSDGEDIYIMLQEFPENENGFINPTLTSIDSYKSWLAENAASSSQTGLVDGWKVPQDVYKRQGDGNGGNQRTFLGPRVHPGCFLGCYGAGHTHIGCISRQ